MSDNIYQLALDSTAEGITDSSMTAQQEEAVREGAYIPSQYSVTDYENDETVLANYEVLTDYLAKTQGVGRYAIDQASTGQTDDVAEYMRDLTARIGAPISLAASLKNAPEEVKRAYRVMKTRWDKASITGSGETFDAIKDYASDVVFSPEGLATVGGLLSGVTTFGAGTAATVAARRAAQQAGQNALTKAVKASVAAATKNPIKASTLVGTGHGLTASHIMQELDISADIKGREDYSALETVVGGAIGGTFGFALSKGAGLYSNSKHGNKAFRESTEPRKELPAPEASKAFDEGVEGEWIPASGGSVVDEALRISGPEGATAKTVNGTDDATARTFDMDDEALDAAATKFAEDLGGGEATKKEILARIRAAADNETTVEGRTSAIKQGLYTVASDLTGNFYGKAAGVLSPITKFSGTAAQLQKKLSHEFGIKYKIQDEVVAKDLSEVQREVTGKFNERFRSIVDSLSLSELDTKLATDINDALSKSMRSNKPLKHSGFDDTTNAAINRAALETRELYNEMGVKLQSIGIIDKLQENYVPRMWSRSAIEKNKKGLIEKFVTKAGMTRTKAKATVENMLDVKNQVDAGSGGGHFFSAKRKINTIGNDADFEEFLNSDVLGSLHAYTFQAGKSIAKHRVLGVNNFDDFKGFYVNRIRQEMEEAGQEFSPKIERQLEKLYRSATGEGMERYGNKTQLAVDAYSFTNRVALLGLATVSSLTEVFLNIQKAGVRNSVKGFADAMQQSHKRITKDLESELRNKNGLTANEALKEMRDFSIHVDQALAQVGDRLAGDELMTEGLQKASNKFFRLNMLDQWTKFVQNVSHSSGKSLVNENIEKLATRYKGKPLDRDGEILAGELAELGIDFKQATKWYDGGAKRTDDFYKNDFLGGVARYTNSVVLQPTAMSGLKPLLFSNPKTAVFFQLLSYPAAFSNTVLKGAAKSLIKAPTRNGGKIVAAGAIMTGMARWTNYLRTGGESERGKDLDEILGTAVARWGGNGLLLDSFQRAQTASKYAKSNLAYATMPFGPAASDTLKLIQQGIIPTVGGKVPILSGSYFGDTLIGEDNVRRYKGSLRDAQKDVFGGFIEEFDKKPKTLQFNAGGKVAAEASSALLGLFKKPNVAPIEESLPVALSGDMLGTLKSSTKGLINDKALQQTANKIEGAVGLELQSGKIQLNEAVASELAEANISTMLNAKLGYLDDAKNNSNFQKGLNESDPAKASENMAEYQRDLGYTDDQIFALQTLAETKDVGNSKDVLKLAVSSELESVKRVYEKVNINITEADRAAASKANFDEESLDATHDFLTAVIKTKEPLISEEGAPIIARDAIVKIAANGNVDFSKFKAPRLDAQETIADSLTDAQRTKALQKHVAKSDTQEIIYRSIKTFKTSEFNVAFPFAREMGMHGGSEGVANTIKLRDMLFDLYPADRAANIYKTFKNSKPTKTQYEKKFEQLNQVAKDKHGSDYVLPANEMQAGYISARKPLVYNGETIVDTWAGDKILASKDGINELLTNVEDSGGKVTKASIERMKALRSRAMDIQTRPKETLVDVLETDLMKNELNIDLRTELQRFGFDSVKYKNEIEFGFNGESEYSYILFEPEQFKLTTSAKFDAADPRQNYAIGSLVSGITKAFAPKKTSGFYSAAEKASQKLTGSKPKPGQAHLNAMKKDPKVTEEELDWTGATEKFGNNKPVTKEEVQEFFGQSDFDFDVNVGRHVKRKETVDEDMPLDDLSDDAEFDLFDDWLTENKPFEKEMMDDLLDSDDPMAWDRMYDELMDEFNAGSATGGDFVTIPTHLDYAFEGADTLNYRELVFSLPSKFKKVNKDYKHSHFPDIANPVAHVRLADAEQVDDAFNKTLLIDEIQSDAQQAGKAKGYATREDYDSATMESAEELIEKVPDLPFKSEKRWALQGLRKAMITATDEGYDQVALTTGRMQAERNNKNIEAGEGKKFLDFYDKTLMKLWKNNFAKKYGVEIKMVEYKQNDSTVTLPTLEITDAMRKDIQKGLPMFAEGGEVISAQAQQVAKDEPVSLLTQPRKVKPTSGRTIAALRANLKGDVA